MPFPLTEEIEFTSPIIVPDGDDFMDDAAEVIQALAQGLANRDAWAKDLLDNKVVKNDQGNTITGALAIVTTDEAAPPLKIVNAPTGKWRPCFEAACDASGDRKIMVFQGTDDNEGALAITVNARWQLSPQQWRQQNAAKKSFGLLFVPNGSGLRFSVQDAGVSSWTVWPEKGIFTAGGGGLFGADGLAALGIIHSYAKVTSQGDFETYDGDFVRQVARARERSIIPLGDVCGAYTRTATGIKSDDTSSAPFWTVRVPPNCTLGTIQIMHTKLNTGSTTFTLVPRTGAVWNLLAPVKPATDDEVVESSTTAGLQITELDASALEPDPGVSELMITWDRPNDSANDEVHQLCMVDWTELGPRAEVL